MATTTEDLRFEIVVDPSGAVKGLKALGTSVDKVEEETEQADKATKDWASTLKKAGASIVVLNQGLELAAKAYRAVIGPATEMVNLFREQERAEQAVANSLKLQNQFTQEALQSYKEFASALQEVSTVGDETSLQLLSIAKAAKLTDEQAMGLVETSVNMSAALGKNLRGTFNALLTTFKGIAGPVEQYNQSLTTLTKTQLRAGGAVEVLKKQFEGFAEGTLDTLNASIIQTQNAWGDLLEVFGQTIAESLGIVDIMRSLKDVINDAIAVVNVIGPAVSDLSQAFFELAGAVLGAFGEILAGFGDIGVAIGLFSEEAITGKDVLELLVDTLKMVADFTRQVAAAVRAVDFRRLVEESKTLWGILLALAAPTVITAVVTGLWGMASAAAAAAVPLAVLAAKATLVVAAVLAAASAIDIFIRNLDLIVPAVKVAAATVVVEWVDANAKFQEVVVAGIAFLLGRLSEFAGVFSSTVAKSFDDAAKKLKLTAAQGRKEFVGMVKPMRDFRDKEAARIKESFDFGFAGEAMKQGANLVNALTGETRKLGDEAERTGAALKDMNVGAAASGTEAKIVTQQQTQALRTLQQETAALESTLAGLSRSSVAVAQQTLEMERTKLQLKKEQLAAEDRLSAAAERELTKQLALIEKIGSINIANARKAEADAIMAANMELLRLETEILNANLSTGDQIQNNLALELRSLDVKRQQIMADKSLTDEARARLAVLVDQEKALREQKAAQAQEQSGREAGGLSQDAFVGLKDTFSEGAAEMAGSIATAIGTMASPVAAFGNAVVGIANSITALINLPEQIINAVAGIFEALNEFPSKIIAALRNLFSQIGEFLSEGIRDIIEMIPVVLIDTIMFLFTELPNLLIDLVADLPDMLINGLISRLPEIVTKLVKGLVSGLPRLVIGLTVGLVKAAPKLAIALMKTLAIELPKAIVDGLKEGAKAIFDAVKAALTGKSLNLDVDTEGLEDTIKNIGRTVTKATEDVFAVVDLMAEARGFSQAEEIGQAIEEATKKSVNWLTWAWNKLVEVWRHIWNTILEPIVDLLREAWLWVWNEILEPMGKLIGEAFLWVWDEVLEPILGLTQEAFGWIVDEVFRPIIGIVGEAFTWVFDTLGKVFTDIGKAFSGVGKGIMDGISLLMDGIMAVFNGLPMLFDGIIKGIASVFNALPDLFEGLGRSLTGALSGVLELFKGVFQGAERGLRSAMTAVADLLSEVFRSAENGLRSVVDFFKTTGEWISSALWGFVRFFDTIGKGISDALWGFVRFFKTIGEHIAGLLDINVGGGGISMDSVKSAVGFQEGGPVPGFGLADSVDAKLTPGEFVLNTRGRQALGDDVLTAANAGQRFNGGGGGQNFNIEVSVSTTGAVDEGMLATRIMDEIRNRSESGRYVINQKGVKAG